MIKTQKGVDLAMTIDEFNERYISTMWLGVENINPSFWRQKKTATHKTKNGKGKVGRALRKR